MARTVGQDPDHKDTALAAVAQTPVFRAKAIKVVLISNPVKGISSSSLVIRVIQSSSIVVSIMCLPRVYANGTRRFIKGR